MDSDAHQLDILYVITKSNWGGAQRYVYECVTHMNLRRRTGVALGGNGLFATKLAAAGIPVFPIPAFERDISLSKELLSTWQLFQLFRKLQPRIVHLNSSKAGGLGALAAILAGVPRIVFTSHGLPFEEDRPWWQRYAIVFFTWLTFALCDAVIAITEANYQIIRSMPLMKERVRLVRSGIPPVVLLSQKEARAKLTALAEIPELPRNTLWIGTAAELHPNKGLTHLIEAIRIVREKHEHIACVIMGGGELKEMLEKQVIESGLTQHVFFAGFVPDAATYLSAFTIVTLISIKEGLPYSALEAGSVGAAFVGTALPGIKEIVTDMQSGILVQPKRPKEIAGALALFIEDTERRQVYGRMLKLRIERDFSVDRMLREMSELYDSLLNSHRK